MSPMNSNWLTESRPATAVAAYVLPQVLPPTGRRSDINPTQIPGQRWMYEPGIRRGAEGQLVRGR